MNNNNQRTPKHYSRRDFVKAVGVGTASLLVGADLFADEGSTKRPNIILIMADDVSAKEFSCYGHNDHRTPILDGLAQTGVRFETCWCTPICSPTRAEIMTGRYGFRTGWYHNQLRPLPGQPGRNLTDRNLIFAQLLKKAGYATAICGKWQLSGTQEEYGFDECCMWEKYEGFDGPIETKKAGTLPGRHARYWHPSIVRNHQPVPTTDKDYGPDIFVDFLLDFVKRKKDGPFLVYYPMCLPHISWDFEAKRSGYLPVPEVDENGKKTGAKVPGSLKSNVECIDRLIGRIVDGLEELGVRENTIVLFAADNGTSGYGKCQLTMERGPRVPMIVNCPGLVKPLGAVDTLIDFSDVLPTLCELGRARLPTGYVIDGRSFAHLLRGQPGKERDWIFSFYLDKRWLRDKRWLLDGEGKFYDCGNRRDEHGYKDVTDSTDPEVVAARRRFEEILKDLPPPPESVRARKEKNPSLRAQQQRRAQQQNAP